LLSSPTYFELVLDAAELQKVDLGVLDFSESASSSSSPSSSNGDDDGHHHSHPRGQTFYLALLNLLTMHAGVAFAGVGLGALVDPARHGSKIAYRVGGEVLTIVDVHRRLTQNRPVEALNTQETVSSSEEDFLF
jgi:hypothetical protein